MPDLGEPCAPDITPELVCTAPSPQDPGQTCTSEGTVEAPSATKHCQVSHDSGSSSEDASKHEKRDEASAGGVPAPKNTDAWRDRTPTQVDLEPLPVPPSPPKWVWANPLPLVPVPSLRFNANSLPPSYQRLLTVGPPFSDTPPHIQAVLYSCDVTAGLSPIALVQAAERGCLEDALAVSLHWKGRDGQGATLAHLAVYRNDTVLLGECQRLGVLETLRDCRDVYGRTPSQVALDPSRLNLLGGPYLLPPPRCPFTAVELVCALGAVDTCHPDPEAASPQEYSPLSIHSRPLEAADVWRETERRGIDPLEVLTGKSIFAAPPSLSADTVGTTVLHALLENIPRISQALLLHLLRGVLGQPLPASLQRSGRKEIPHAMADPSVALCNGESPLHVVARLGDKHATPLADALLEHIGVEAVRSLWPLGRGGGVKSPIITAIRHGNVAMATHLLATLCPPSLGDTVATLRHSVCLEVIWCDMHSLIQAFTSKELSQWCSDKDEEGNVLLAAARALSSPCLTPLLDALVSDGCIVEYPSCLPSALLPLLSRGCSTQLCLSLVNSTPSACVLLDREREALALLDITAGQWEGVQQVLESLPGGSSLRAILQSPSPLLALCSKTVQYLAQDPSPVDFSHTSVYPLWERLLAQPLQMDEVIKSPPLWLLELPPNVLEWLLPGLEVDSRPSRDARLSEDGTLCIPYSPRFVPWGFASQLLYRRLVSPESLCSWLSLSVSRHTGGCVLHTLSHMLVTSTLAPQHRRYIREWGSVDAISSRDYISSVLPLFGDNPVWSCCRLVFKPIDWRYATRLAVYPEFNVTCSQAMADAAVHELCLYMRAPERRWCAQRQLMLCHTQLLPDVRALLGTVQTTALQPGDSVQLPLATLTPPQWLEMAEVLAITNIDLTTCLLEPRNLLSLCHRTHRGLRQQDRRNRDYHYLDCAPVWDIVMQVPQDIRMGMVEPSMAMLELPPALLEWILPRLKVDAPGPAEAEATGDSVPPSDTLAVPFTARYVPTTFTARLVHRRLVSPEILSSWLSQSVDRQTGGSVLQVTAHMLLAATLAPHHRQYLSEWGSTTSDSIHTHTSSLLSLFGDKSVWGRCSLEFSTRHWRYAARLARHTELNITCTKAMADAATHEYCMYMRAPEKRWVAQRDHMLCFTHLEADVRAMFSHAKPGPLRQDDSTNLPLCCLSTEQWGVAEEVLCQPQIVSLRSHLLLPDNLLTLCTITVDGLRQQGKHNRDFHRLDCAAIWDIVMRKPQTSDVADVMGTFVPTMDLLELPPPLLEWLLPRLSVDTMVVPHRHDPDRFVYTKSLVECDKEEGEDTDCVTGADSDTDEWGCCHFRHWDSPTSFVGELLHRQLLPAKALCEWLRDSKCHPVKVCVLYAATHMLLEAQVRQELRPYMSQWCGASSQDERQTYALTLLSLFENGAAWVESAMIFVTSGTGIPYAHTMWRTVVALSRFRRHRIIVNEMAPFALACLVEYGYRVFGHVPCPEYTGRNKHAVIFEASARLLPFSMSPAEYERDVCRAIEIVRECEFRQDKAPEPHWELCDWLARGQYELPESVLNALCDWISSWEVPADSSAPEWYEVPIVTLLLERHGHTTLSQVLSGLGSSVHQGVMIRKIGYVQSALVEYQRPAPAHLVLTTYASEDDSHDEVPLVLDMHEFFLRLLICENIDWRWRYDQRGAMLYRSDYDSALHLAESVTRIYSGRHPELLVRLKWMYSRSRSLGWRAVIPLGDALSSEWGELPRSLEVFTRSVVLWLLCPAEQARAVAFAAQCIATLPPTPLRQAISLISETRDHTWAVRLPMLAFALYRKRPPTPMVSLTELGLNCQSAPVLATSIDEEHGQCLTPLASVPIGVSLSELATLLSGPRVVHPSVVSVYLSWVRRHAAVNRQRMGSSQLLKVLAPNMGVPVLSRLGGSTLETLDTQSVLSLLSEARVTLPSLTLAASLVSAAPRVTTKVTSVFQKRLEGCKGDTSRQVQVLKCFSFHLRDEPRSPLWRILPDLVRAVEPCLRRWLFSLLIAHTGQHAVVTRVFRAFSTSTHQEEVEYLASLYTSGYRLPSKGEFFATGLLSGAVSDTCFADDSAPSDADRAQRDLCDLFSDLSVSLGGYTLEAEYLYFIQCPRETLVKLLRHLMWAGQSSPTGDILYSLGVLEESEGRLLLTRPSYCSVYTLLDSPLFLSVWIAMGRSKDEIEAFTLQAIQEEAHNETTTTGGAEATLDRLREGGIRSVFGRTLAVRALLGDPESVEAGEVYRDIDPCDTMIPGRPPFVAACSVAIERDTPPSLPKEPRSFDPQPVDGNHWCLWLDPPNRIEVVRGILDEVRAVDIRALSDAVQALDPYTVAATLLSQMNDSLQSFLRQHPLHSLCGTNVSPLLSEFVPLLTEYRRAITSLQETEFDVEGAIELARSDKSTLDHAQLLVPVPDSSTTSATVCMGLPGPIDPVYVAEFNAVVAEVAEALTNLLDLDDSLSACTKSLEGVDPDAVKQARSIRSRVEEMYRELQCRQAEEADMREIIAELKALPVVAQDRHDELEEDIAICDVRIARCMRSGKNSERFQKEKASLQEEQNAIYAVTAKGRSLVVRLNRHLLHPEAAEVLASNPLDHPLDGTSLSPFAKSCLHLPLHTFRPEPFETCGRAPLLQGTHPESHLPVVLKGYDLNDKIQMEHARREVSVYTTVRDVHIVQFLGLVVEGPTCYIVTEMYDCNLMDFLGTQPCTETLRYIGRQVLEAMATLEGHRVVHRDIKPQNIFINHTKGRVTGVALGDFDISRNSQDFVTTLERTAFGTVLFLDQESFATKQFDALSDVYSFGRTMQVVFAGGEGRGIPLFGVTTFTCPALSTLDVALINRCLGPKAQRFSAYHMAAAGLFAVPSTASPDSSDAALGRLQRLQALLWQQVQAVKQDSPTVPCTPESLLQHYRAPATPGITGHCRLEGTVVDGEEVKPLDVLLSALQKPMSINGMQVTLLEAGGDGTYQLIPSIEACCIMIERRESGDTSTLDAIRDAYAALGRFLAFQLLEGPFPHGLFGMAVYAAMRGGINAQLQDEAAVSRLFAATFPAQRRSLLRLLENPVPVPFDSVPGALESDLVLDEHNTSAFARVFESSYVRLTMEAGVEIHRGYCSLHQEYGETVAALTLDQFLTVAASLPAITADRYMLAFDIKSERLKEAFSQFVQEQSALQNDTLLRLLLVFATGSAMLPQSRITLVLATDTARLALPSAQQCTATITVPDTCLGHLDVAFQDSCDSAGISIGDGTKTRQKVEADLNNELNRFRELSASVHTCPSCGVAVEKSEGCNHITCHCGKHWCWACGFVSTREGPVYAHMVEKHGGL
ncbi:hypothetical protein KIPB_001761 [Kipferlia bialata]|uniref:mitogen-activated protein kinase kinase n=1 Tax=Kipferlia bialata TaxID=797122 RepID=A0A9K3CR22_9EUKA|nr:hypothetical protein KIPB_001761 [Kipferlia bialata]|eukprot:g1761.t1